MFAALLLTAAVLLALASVVAGAYCGGYLGYVALRNGCEALAQVASAVAVAVAADSAE